MQRLNPASRQAFTLLELLLVIGMIAVVASIVMSAIDPASKLAEARDTKRRVEIRELQNAITQYLIDDNVLRNIPNGIGNAINVCRESVDPNDCTGAGTGYSLSALVPLYVVSLPVDPAETNPQETGYGIYLYNNQLIYVCSPMLTEDCGIEKPI